MATGLSLPWEPKDLGLQVRLPLRPRGDQKRWLLVTGEIADLLDGRQQYGAFPAHEAEVTIGKYSAGHLVAVSLQRTDRKPDLERLDGYDEVWALCFRKPTPGWRLLGRFYCFNVFIALRAWDKHKLASRYDEADAEVISDWKRMFGENGPHRGAVIDDYISQVFRNVDETF